MNRLETILKENGITVNEEMISRFLRYQELLLEWNEKINLTAITQEEDIYYKHFLDSLLAATLPEIILKGKRLIDVGTGAGFPGVPLAIYERELEVTLTDSLRKRMDYLGLVKEDLDLQNVTLVTGRAEDLGQDTKYREQYDIAVARAVSRLPVLLEYVTPFLKIGGLFIAYKGPEYPEELQESRNAMKILGLELAFVNYFPIRPGYMERNLIAFRKMKSTPKNYPRKAGTPQRKPL